MAHRIVADIPIVIWQRLCVQAAGDYRYPIRPPCDARWARSLRGVVRTLCHGGHAIGDLDLRGYGCALGQLLWAIRLLPGLLQALDHPPADPVATGMRKQILESLLEHHVAAGDLPGFRHAILDFRNDPEMHGDDGGFLFEHERLQRGPEGSIHTKESGSALRDWMRTGAMDDLCYLQQVGSPALALERLLGDPFGRHARLAPIIPSELVRCPPRLQRAFHHAGQLEEALRSDLVLLGNAGFAEEGPGLARVGAFTAALAHWFSYAADSEAKKHEGVWYGLAWPQDGTPPKPWDWRWLVAQPGPPVIASAGRRRTTARLLQAMTAHLRAPWTDAATIVDLVGEEWRRHELPRPCPLLVSLLWRFLAQGAIATPPVLDGQRSRPSPTPSGRAFDPILYQRFLITGMQRLRATAALIWPDGPRADVLDQALATSTFLYAGRLNGAPAVYRSVDQRLVAEVGHPGLPVVGRLLQDLPGLLTGTHQPSPGVAQACRILQATQDRPWVESWFALCSLRDDDDPTAYRVSSTDHTG